MHWACTYRSATPSSFYYYYFFKSIESLSNVSQRHIRKAIRHTYTSISFYVWKELDTVCRLHDRINQTRWPSKCTVTNAQLSNYGIIIVLIREILYEVRTYDCPCCNIPILSISFLIKICIFLFGMEKKHVTFLALIMDFSNNVNDRAYI